MRYTYLKIILLAVILLLGSIPQAHPLGVRDKKHGLDLSGMDKTVHPGDDFFGYTNGGWMKATNIPEDRASYGVFDILAEEAREQTANLIKEAGKSATDAEARKIGAYYDAYMDEKAIEELGLNPVQVELDEIKAINNKTALADVLGSQLRADVDPLNSTNFYTDRLFGLWVSLDFNRPTRNVAYLLQGGLGLPDRDNYLSKETSDVELQTKYREHIAIVLKLAGMADADAQAARIYELERKIAEAHTTRTDSNDVHKANNPWPLQSFSARAPGLDWRSYFKAAGLSAQPMIMVWHPAGVKGI